MTLQGNLAAHDPSPKSAWTSVRSYGAAGDGTTDDTAAIRTAIVAAGVGGMLHFPAGTYRVSSAVIPLSGQTIHGTGATLFRLPAMTADIIALPDDAADVAILGLTLDGNEANTPNGLASGVKGTRPRRCRIERVHIRNMPASGHGVQFIGGSDNVVSASAFANCGYGVFLGLLANSSDALERNLVTGCTVNGTTHDGIFLTGSAGSTASTSTPHGNMVIGNTLTQIGDSAIESGIGCVGTVIANNTIHPTLVGGVLLSSFNAAVLFRDNIGGLAEGNTIAGCTHGGIGVVAQITASSSITIGPNTVTGCGGDGLAISGSYGNTEITITGGLYHRNAGRGVYISGVTNFTITGATCMTNASSGIVLNNCTNGQVVGCTSANNKTGTSDGLVTLGSTTGVLFDGLRAYGNAHYGLHLYQGRNLMVGTVHLSSNGAADFKDDTGLAITFTCPNALEASGPVGSVVKKIQVFNSTGNSLGYIPIYSKV